ncbi:MULTISPECIES: IS200/IS605 family transposase [unclassified Polaribacter]|uniref:IS200/IS605 family transposase n=1 Tax=unclassified Polaribacter TaxID=196858 RepID=UPI0011BF01A9|nr:MULTISPECIES: IS200/IS605 family transposase [unclassified Polaribacter]TXD51646.1 IS200/IS605 family transposase [Polaribacter sp. IC063]TXD58806.1 IS200/IS605 family transposase [Polaribacter sp. IC066]
MSFIKVYIHFVWSTKNRVPFLETKELRQKVWKHIKKNGKEKGIHIDFVNGYSDHCHCLVSLGSDQTIQKLMQLIKGESSFWINQQGLTKEKFQWQTEYFAVSVSESIVEKVRNYIRNQERHHAKKSFQEEYEDFILKYDFKKFDDK